MDTEKLTQTVGRIIGTDCTLDRDVEGHAVIYTNTWFINGDELKQIQDVCHILTISIDGRKLALTVEDLNA